MISSIPRYILLTTVIILFNFSVYGQTQTNENEKTQFSIYGFGRTNFTWDNQDLNQIDIFKPSDIIVGADKDANFFINPNQSRIGLDVKHDFGEDVLEIKLEGDFHNSSSNSTGVFRLRHAYAKYKFVLVGMTWSNFFDIEANPESVDFEGPNSSTLSRTPQLRIGTFNAKNELSISFENPIEKIEIDGSVSTLPIRMPDIIGAYRYNGDFGFIKAAGLFRELRYETDKPRSQFGYGALLMGMLKVGEKDKLKFQGVMGNGIARYIEGASGLNYDAIYVGTNELENLHIYGSYISYQHFWKNHLHSSITGGWLGVEDNENLADTDYKSGYYGSANIFWEAVKNLSFGWEVLVGERLNINDNSGSAIRVQMNATYKFNKLF